MQFRLRDTDVKVSENVVLLLLFKHKPHKSSFTLPQMQKNLLFFGRVVEVGAEKIPDSRVWVKGDVVHSVAAVMPWVR